MIVKKIINELKNPTTIFLILIVAATAVGVYISKKNQYESAMLFFCNVWQGNLSKYTYDGNIAYVCDLGNGYYLGNKDAIEFILYNYSNIGGDIVIYSVPDNKTNELLAFLNSSKYASNYNIIFKDVSNSTYLSELFSIVNSSVAYTPMIIIHNIKIIGFSDRDNIIQYYLNYTR